MKPVVDPLTGSVTLVPREKVQRSGGFSRANLYATLGTNTPASGVDGQLFYDTDDGILYVWANDQWNAISGGGTTPTTYHMLLEDGSGSILLETGDYITQE